MDFQFDRVFYLLLSGGRTKHTTQAFLKEDEPALNIKRGTEMGGEGRGNALMSESTAAKVTIKFLSFTFSLFHFLF